MPAKAGDTRPVSLPPCGDRNYLPPAETGGTYPSGEHPRVLHPMRERSNDAKRRYCPELTVLQLRIVKLVLSILATLLAIWQGL